MTILNLFNNPCMSFSAVIYIILTVTVFLGFIFFLILSYKTENFFIQKFYYLVFGFGISVIYYCFTYYLLVALSIMFFCIALFSMLLIIPKKKYEEEKREFVKYIDSKIQEPFLDEVKESKAVQDENIITAKKIKDKENQKKEHIDYSHVKSVLKRINCYPLSPTDRKVVKELELYLIEAEQGDDRIEIKEKINDNLGCLLKIMAKYGT